MENLIKHIVKRYKKHTLKTSERPRPKINFFATFFKVWGRPKEYDN